MNRLFSLLLLAAVSLTAFGQNKIYRMETATDGKKAVSGFVTIDTKNSEAIFASTLLWTVENICPKLREGITELDVKNKSLKCEWSLASDPATGFNNTYHCKGTFRVLDNKFIFFVTDIFVESTVLLSKKVTPIAKLTPEKKKAHQDIVENFEQTVSAALNNIITYAGQNEMPPVQHWDAIAKNEPAVGMTEKEVLMACGRPQLTSESDGETQWNYGGSLYVFFKKGRVDSILK